MNATIVKLVAPVGAAVALVVALVLGLVGLPWPLAVVVALAVAAAVCWAIPRPADRLVLVGLRTRPLEEADAPRLHNVLDGLCDSHGYRRPQIVLIEDAARNAVAFGRSPDDCTIAITRGLIDSLDRLALEGLLARELVAADDPARTVGSAAVAAGRFVPAAYAERVVAGLADAHAAVRLDFAAAALTRYPPGLAAALAKVIDHAPVRGANPRGRHLWLADPCGPEPVTAGFWAVSTRVDALLEL